MAGEVYLQRVGTATPRFDVHEAFVGFAHSMLKDERARTLFLRMAERSGIESRFSVLCPGRQANAQAGTKADTTQAGHGTDASIDAYELYKLGSFPGTAERMRLFERFAPTLMRSALDALALSEVERSKVRHVLVTSCTGLYAPGLDFAAMEYLGLARDTERTMIGFMGCYAAMNALKQARHIVRSQPDESVLVINLELCTLHFQQTQDLNDVLSFLLFGDGCAASLVGSEPLGLRMESFHAMHLENTRDLITWNIGDQGFDMVLSGQVPLAVGRALKQGAETWSDLPGEALWAVHPGGRSVLDAVEEGLELAPSALHMSRAVLREFGNMSSATVMFVLQKIMRHARPGQAGVAMSFGPGLTAETMRFHAAR